ncbi:hypothetical protein BCF44_12839 [Kutzneria buriramensis]|uniref:Uncharacterized protein n=1 Tax=Kutzneria buriramensis TaxID=1045776 RepID=A0A3E0GUI4_9PSEU|nr:hypothetical protein BCF44_12839 [Kutzneria buriramensis]
MSERNAYTSDLSDQQWAVVGPFLDAWKATPPVVRDFTGRQGALAALDALVHSRRQNNAVECGFARQDTVDLLTPSRSGRSSPFSMAAARNWSKARTRAGWATKSLICSAQSRGL